MKPGRACTPHSARPNTTSCMWPRTSAAPPTHIAAPPAAAIAARPVRSPQSTSPPAPPTLPATSAGRGRVHGRTPAPCIPSRQRARNYVCLVGRQLREQRCRRRAALGSRLGPRLAHNANHLVRTLAASRVQGRQGRRVMTACLGVTAQVQARLRTTGAADFMHAHAHVLATAAGCVAAESRTQAQLLAMPLRAFAPSAGRTSFASSSANWCCRNTSTSASSTTWRNRQQWRVAAGRRGACAAQLAVQGVRMC